MGSSARAFLPALALASALFFASRGPAFLSAAQGLARPDGALRGAAPQIRRGSASASAGIAAGAASACGLAAVAALLSVRRRAATARQAKALSTVELTQENMEMAEMLAGARPLKGSEKMNMWTGMGLKLNGSLTTVDDEALDEAALTKQYEAMKNPGLTLEQYMMTARLEARQVALYAPVSPDAPLVGSSRGWTFGLPWARSLGGVADPGSEIAAKKMIGFDVETRKLGLGPDDGEAYWDPLGFAKLYDRNFDFNGVMTYPHVQWLREAEIKHGRVCMLAFVGMVFQSLGAHVPGYPVASDVWTALDTCYADTTSQLGMVQIWVFITFCEGLNYPRNMWIGRGNREPGDLGWDPLNLKKGKDLETLKLKELKNGRLAMMGMASIAVSHVIPGSVPPFGGLF